MPGRIYAVAAADEPHDIGQLLRDLDGAILQRGTYMQLRSARIDSMVRTLPAAPEQRIDAYIDIARSYLSFRADSSIVYLRRANADADALGDSALIFRTRMALATILPVVDLEREAILIFESVNADALPGEWRREYYDGAADMYSLISEKSHPLPGLSEKYAGMADEYRQHAMRYYPPESPQWLFHEACRFMVDGNYSAAMISGNDLLYRTAPQDLLYGRAAELLARVSALRGNVDDELYYSLHGALSEIMRGDREGMALQRVGHLLYKEGDIDRAHSYLSAALSSASFGVGYHSDMVAESLMIIDNSYRSQWNRHFLIFWGLIVALVVLLFVRGAMLMRYRRYIRDIRKEHDHVMRLMGDRNVYLTNFLKSCALSMRRMSEFSRTVQRKLAARQFEELFNIVKSGSIVDEHRRDLFAMFDRTFLKIYPDFVDELNTILRPEERYATPTEDRLMPELRIAALMRLGLTDTARMAEFLGYSPNTIYAYRAKVRAKALDSTTFDRDFYALGSRE